MEFKNYTEQNGLSSIYNYKPRDKYKGFEYRCDYDDVDDEFRVYFYQNDNWKHFKIELEFMNYIDDLIQNQRDYKLNQIVGS